MALWEKLTRVLGLGVRGSGREDAERLLLEADFGVKATDEILERVAREQDGDLRGALERIVAGLLASPEPLTPGPLARSPTPPTVIVVLGVNGTGKTTTVAKLAHCLAQDQRSVLLAAADTFRAGATQQLRIWADRLGVPCVTGREGGGGDPAAVVFDAITAARSRGIDTVLIDTAGRLHTEDRLLEELKKVVRVAAKAHPAGQPPHECLLVLDGTTGQTAVAQGRAFGALVPLTGLVITKLDGTAKGGSVVALRRELAVPIRFLGTGEEIEDLEEFDPSAYARRLLSA